MSNPKRMSEADFDALVNKLQEQSFKETKDAYGETGFARWQKPAFHGPIANADCQVALTGKCGDTIQLFINFDDGIVTKAQYITDGCASSQLAGSFTSELAHGRTVEELFSLKAEDVLNAIGQLPEDDQHCTDLAVEVLHECANKYLMETTKKARI